MRVVVPSRHGGAGLTAATGLASGTGCPDERDPILDLGHLDDPELVLDRKVKVVASSAIKEGTVGPVFGVCVAESEVEAQLQWPGQLLRYLRHVIKLHDRSSGCVVLPALRHSSPLTFIEPKASASSSAPLEPTNKSTDKSTDQEPNCRLTELRIDGLPHSFLVTTRAISPGEPLTADFGPCFHTSEG